MEVQEALHLLAATEPQRKPRHLRTVLLQTEEVAEATARLEEVLLCLQEVTEHLSSLLLHTAHLPLEEVMAVDSVVALLLVAMVHLLKRLHLLTVLLLRVEAAELLKLAGVVVVEEGLLRLPMELHPVVAMEVILVGLPLHRMEHLPMAVEMEAAGATVEEMVPPDHLLLTAPLQDHLHPMVHLLQVAQSLLHL